MHLERRRLLSGSLAALTTLGLAGCLPVLSPRRPTVVTVAYLGLGGPREAGLGRPGVTLLYKAALDLVRAHPGEIDLRVTSVTAPPPTPAMGPVPPPPGQPPPLPPTITALEQALNQEPAPDLVFFENFDEFAAAVRRTLLQPLDPLAQGDSPLRPADLFPGALAAVSDQGALYGLPLAAEVLVLQYDQRLFNAAGLPPPDSTWTWTTLLNAARTLTQPDKGQYGLNLFSGHPLLILAAFLWQNGGDLVSPDGRRVLLSEGPALETLRFLYDLIHTHNVVARPQRSARAAPGAPSSPRPIVVGPTRPGEAPPLMGPGGQRVAMQFVTVGGLYGGWWRPPGVQDWPLRLAEPPRGRGPASALAVSGVLALTARAADPRAAFQVLAALAGEMVKEMPLPVHRPALQTAFQRPAAPFTPEEGQVLGRALESARALPPSVQSRLGALVFQHLLQPLFEGTRKPEEIAQEAAAALEAALNS